LRTVNVSGGLEFHDAVPPVVDVDAELLVDGRGVLDLGEIVEQKISGASIA